MYTFVTNPYKTEIPWKQWSGQHHMSKIVQHDWQKWHNSFQYNHTINLSVSGNKGSTGILLPPPPKNLLILPPGKPHHHYHHTKFVFPTPNKGKSSALVPVFNFILFIHTAGFPIVGGRSMGAGHPPPPSYIFFEPPLSKWCPPWGTSPT